MSRVRLIPKIHVRHPASKFHSSSKEVTIISYMICSLQKTETTPVLKKSVIISGTETFPQWFMCQGWSMEYFEIQVLKYLLDAQFYEF